MPSNLINFNNTLTNIYQHTLINLGKGCVIIDLWLDCREDDLEYIDDLCADFNKTERREFYRGLLVVLLTPNLSIHRLISLSSEDKNFRDLHMGYVTKIKNKMLKNPDFLNYLKTTDALRIKKSFFNTLCHFKINNNETCASNFSPEAMNEIFEQQWNDLTTTNKEDFSLEYLFFNRGIMKQIFSEQNTEEIHFRTMTASPEGPSSRYSPNLLDESQNSKIQRKPSSNPSYLGRFFSCCYYDPDTVIISSDLPNLS